MHYSQLKKHGSSRKNAHPGTPRPNPLQENFQSTISSRYYPSRDAADCTSTVATQSLPQEHLSFNFKRQEKSSANKSQQRLCGLPIQEKAYTHVSPTNSNETLPDHLIWVKNEPFDFGILSTLPCPKIGINILRKVAEYCREKPGHYPQLSLNQWNHICKYKMQLAIDLSFAYFRTFDLITRSNSTSSQHHHHHPSPPPKNGETLDSAGDIALAAPLTESRDAKFHRVFKQGHDLNEELKVDTLQFLLFLYIQHFLRLHKKYFVKSYGDETWPKAWVSNLMQKSNGAGTGANVPEQQQAEFIMANLPDIVDFLMIMHETSSQTSVKPSGKESESLMDNQKKGTEDHAFTMSACSTANATEQVQVQRIHVDVIKALNLILGVASTIPSKEFKSLDECLLNSDIRWKLKYSRYNRTVDKKCFIQWVVKNLKINPWGPSSVPIPQVSVSVMTGVWDEQEVFRQNKIFWNTQSYPKSWLLISGVEKQVLLIDTLEPMSSIKIHRCTNSFIYLPGVHSFILIQKCQGITLNLGVASKVVKCIDCSGITVSGVGRQFIISDVSQSTFYMLTPSSPIICGSKNHEILLGPYNTVYPNLSSDLKTAGISPKIQRWNKPLEIANDGFPRGFQQPNVCPLAPEQFKVFHFPFKMHGSSNTNTNSSLVLTGTLPSTYQRRVEYPAEKMEDARKEFAQKLMLSEDDTSLIYQITLQRLKKWLKDSGNYEHVVGLRSYQKSVEQQSSRPLVCSKGHDVSCVSKVLKNFFKSGSEGIIPQTVRSSKSISLSKSNLKKQFSEDKEEHETSLQLRRHHSSKTLKGAGDEESIKISSCLHQDQAKGKHNYIHGKQTTGFQMANKVQGDE